MFVRNSGAVLFLAVMLQAVACSRDCVPPAPLDTSDILVAKPSSGTKPFGIDICLDATPSMEGFALPPNSIYATFLEDLEGSMVSGVRNVSDIRYFKFGERIREVKREEFRAARSRAFYHEPGMFKTTDIERVFERAKEGRSVPSSGERVVVVVTDLFQSDQDVNAVVSQVKSHCLSDPHCSIGVLAIPSEFDGTVYDARVPPFPYASSHDAATFRPFYLLMFGPEEQLRLFADVLSSRKYIDLQRFTIIGAHAVTQFSAQIARDPASKGVVPRKQCGTALDGAFNLRKGFSEAAIKTRLDITPDPEAFAFNPARVIVQVHREAAGKAAPADEVRVSPSTKERGALELAASITPPAQRGDYVYVFDVLAGETNGFVLPKWVTALSSTDPRPDHDASKTLNLDRFMSELIATSMVEDHHQPRLARFRVLIHKL